MSKKSKYEPHPRLATKRTDSSDAEYNRARNRYTIEEYLDDMNETNDPCSVNTIESEEALHNRRFGGDTGIDADFQFEYAANTELEQEMYEQGFHYEQPEN